MFCPKFKRITAYRWLNMTRKAKRRHVARRAEKEIKQIQKTPKHVFSTAAFKRLLRELAFNWKTDVRFSKSGNEAMAEFAQDIVTKLFKDMGKAAEHAGRKTVMPKDLHFVLDQWVEQNHRVEARS